jgi:hypothetical protein
LALQHELQEKFPQPEGVGSTLDEEAWGTLAGEVDRLVQAIPCDDRIDAQDLLEAARRVRGTAAPGPDGWSGGYLRRLATLFPRQVADIL